MPDQKLDNKLKLFKSRRAKDFPAINVIGIIVTDSLVLKRQEERKLELSKVPINITMTPYRYFLSVSRVKTVVKNQTAAVGSLSDVRRKFLIFLKISRRKKIGLVNFIFLFFPN